MKKNILKTFTAALIISLTLFTASVVLQTASAQQATRKTYAFIGATPNPVQVGEGAISRWNYTTTLKCCHGLGGPKRNN